MMKILHEYSHVDPLTNTEEVSLKKQASFGFNELKVK